ncbi:MAG TPA: hypothetical protein VGM03_19085, partial [Phycisphaerae bacterium]
NASEDEIKLQGWMSQLQTPQVACWACRSAYDLVLNFVERFDNITELAIQLIADRHLVLDRLVVMQQAPDRVAQAAEAARDRKLLAGVRRERKFDHQNVRILDRAHADGAERPLAARLVLCDGQIADVLEVALRRL